MSTELQDHTVIETLFESLPSIPNETELRVVNLDIFRRMMLLMKYQGQLEGITETKELAKEVVDNVFKTV